MPDDATFLSRSRTNAGYALMQAGDAAGAREAYEAAIALDPGNVQAHHGMAAALEALGDRAASLRHFDEACRLRPVRRHAFGGTGTPLNLLLLLSARMGNLNAYPLLDDRAIAATTVFLEHADRAGLPAHDAIFNGIADADSNSSALHEAVAWLRGATVPVLNDPARVALTSRQDNAARLARIAGARVPAIARVARAELERGVGTRGIGCPLLLRSPGYHNGRHFVLVRSGGDLAAAAHALPGDDLYVIEFLDVRDDDGMVRKYRVLAIAGNHTSALCSSIWNTSEHPTGACPSMRFATKAIHVGQEADPTTGATIVPIYQTSTYTQERVGVHKGFDYSRTVNPTRLALEKQLAALEGAEHACAFASGMAATSAVLNLLSAGDHAIVSDDLYGGTYRLFSRVFERYGVSFTYVDMTDESAVREAVRANTKLFWIETPTNPLLKLVDVRAICALRREGQIVAVDNTFATPYFQQPLALGADVVVHSTTKYIGGHSDVVGGVAIATDARLYETIKFHQNAVGGIPGPHDAWLTMRGAKTLAVRMREHARNAQAVAEFLAGHDGVARVYYPGLPSHPQHALAKRQMSGFGGMVSFVLEGPQERALDFAHRLHYFSLAESLGGVESLICHPARMTHGSIPKEHRERLGVTDGLLRLSVGIEDQDETLADLRLDWKILWSVLRIGVPTGIQVMMVSLAELAVISFVNRFGSSATAAYGAVNQIAGYVQFPAISIGISASIFGAQCIGARREDKLGSVIRSAVGLNYAIGGALIALCYAFAWALLGWFITDPYTLRIAHELLTITLWSYAIFVSVR